MSHSLVCARFFSIIIFWDAHQKIICEKWTLFISSNLKTQFLSKAIIAQQMVKRQNLSLWVNYNIGIQYLPWKPIFLKENCFCMHFRKNGISPRWLNMVLFFLLLFLGFVCMKKMAPRNWGECQGFYLKWGSENGPWKWVYGPLVANVGIFSAILRAKWRPCGWSSKPSKPFLVLPHNTRMTASQSFTT